MNRQIWKGYNYVLASISYLVSLGLAFVAFIALIKGLAPVAIFATLFALYFIQQGIYVLIVSEIVERRRSHQRIDFPERRRAA